MTSKTVNASDERTVCPNPQTGIPAELIDVKAVSLLLGGCSTRHVYRLSDADLMPRPIRLGSLVRWRRSDLLEWIEGGCQPTRAAKGTTR